MKTLTVKQLIETLKGLPKNSKVYLSSDTEGNSYGTIRDGELGSIFYCDEDNVVIIKPYEEYLTEEEAMPKMSALIDEEMNDVLGKVQKEREA